MPLLAAVRAALPDVLGPKAAGLVADPEGRGLMAEGNYNYNEKCGIGLAASTLRVGFHGDSERRLVVAARVGRPMPLHYQWFFRGAPVGVYVMSAKAVGRDWKRPSVPTLRHAAGAPKYLSVKRP